MAQGKTIEINRAPVLTLWAAVVAERLGLFEPSPEDVKRKREEAKGQFEVELLNHAVPAVMTPKGICVIAKGKPSRPENVSKYLEASFGEDLKPVRDAMMHLESWAETFRLKPSNRAPPMGHMQPQFRW